MIKENISLKIIKNINEPSEQYANKVREKIIVRNKKK